MLAEYVSVGVVWTGANPFVVVFADGVLSVVRLTLDSVSAIVNPLNMIRQFCDCLTALLSGCCQHNHFTTPLLCSISNNYYKNITTKIINTTKQY